MLEHGENRQLTPDQANLRLVETRIRGLKIHNSGSPEIKRMEVVRADLIGRMPKGELAAYEKMVNPVKSKAQLDAEAEAERAAMDANKDRPPI
jgi:hypothetical protein